MAKWRATIGSENADWNAAIFEGGSAAPPDDAK
jgi:hypothetical protein